MRPAHTFTHSLTHNARQQSTPETCLVNLFVKAALGVDRGLHAEP